MKKLIQRCKYLCIHKKRNTLRCYLGLIQGDRIIYDFFKVFSYFLNFLNIKFFSQTKHKEMYILKGTLCLFSYGLGSHQEFCGCLINEQCLIAPGAKTKMFLYGICFNFTVIS